MNFRSRMARLRWQRLVAWSVANLGLALAKALTGVITTAYRARLVKPQTALDGLQRAKRLSRSVLRAWGDYLSKREVVKFEMVQRLANERFKRRRGRTRRSPRPKR